MCELRSIVTALYEHLLRLCRDALHDVKEELAAAARASAEELEQGQGRENSLADGAGAEAQGGIKGARLPVNNIVVAQGMPKKFQIPSLQMPGEPTIAPAAASTSAVPVPNHGARLVPVSGSGNLSSGHIGLLDRGAVASKWLAHQRATLGGGADPKSLRALSELEEERLLRNDLVQVIRALLLGVDPVSVEGEGSAAQLDSVTSALTMSTEIMPISPIVENPGGSLDGNVVTATGDGEGAMATTTTMAVTAPLMHPAVYATLAQAQPETLRAHLVGLSAQFYLPVGVIASRIREICDGMTLPTEQVGGVASNAAPQNASPSPNSDPSLQIPMASFSHSTPKAYHSGPPRK